MSSAGLQRILCVDDEPRVLEGLERTLFEHFDVTTSESPLRALGLLAAEHEPFAAIISDMRMPLMNGATFLARARGLVPNSTRMLLTGQVDLDVAISAVNEGNIFRFLTKPCAPETLIAAIHAGVEQHRLITAERELLEQTLTGSIRLLSEVLSLLAPQVFERTQRIKAYVVHMSTRLELEDRWRFELAAALCMVGCVALPEQTLERMLSGRALSAEEKHALSEHPATAYRLLAGIPRFGEVAEMIRLQLRGPEVASSDQVQLGATLLRLACELDQLVQSGTQLPAALASLQRTVPEVERSLLATLQDFQGIEASTQLRALRVGQMTSRMRLEEDVRTTAGVVVIPKGRELTGVLLERLRNFSAAGSLIEPIRVRVPF